MTSKDKSSRGGNRPAGGEHAKRNTGASRSEGRKPARAAEGGEAKPKRFGKGAPAKSFTVSERSAEPRGEGAPARSSKPRSDKPRSDKPRSDKPRDGKPAAATGDGGKPTFGKYASAKSGMPFAKKAGKSKPFPVKEGAARARPVAADADSAESGIKPERISKIMARAGVASRRDIERMIMDGRVRLNGEILDTPVVNATMNDVIEVDGVPIRGIERTRLWLYHKPAGLVTTNSDPEGRPTVFENLPADLPRVLSIGRLDINTEGLLLLTNDGGLSRVLELPATGWLRRYRVRAHGEIDQAKLDQLKDGIAVDGVLYGGIEAVLDRQQGHNVWITMGLREGKNREIKNVLGALGLDVNRLIRLSYGPFQLGDLPEGAVVEVRGRMLRDQLGPRLIEEAKANFDAPIYDAPAVASADEDEEDAAPAPARGWQKEARPARSDRPARGDKPMRGERPSGKFDKASGKGRGADAGGEGEASAHPKRPALGSIRTANVWMAPGARPVTEKARGKRGTEEAKARPMTASPDLKGPRVTVNRAAEDKDWIRAENPAPGKEDGGFGRKKSFGDKPRGDRGDRPERGERSYADKPRGERSFGDKPRGERAFGDRPRGERSSEDRPRGERAFGDKPRGERGERSERPYGDKPRGERSFGDKPRGERSERSFGDKPLGERSERSFGDKPAGGRGFGGKPGAKSFGGKPGGRPAGGKPGGRPSGGKPGGSRPSGGRPSGGSRSKG